MELSIQKAAPVGIYIAFCLALYVWHVGASLLGVFIAERLGVGDNGFDLKGDLKKMSLCSLVALSLFFFLFYFVQSPVVFMAYILTFLISLKFAYLGSNQGVLFIILGTAQAGMIAFVPVAGLLKLPGLFCLYLVFLVAFLLRRQKNQKRERETMKAALAKERHIRYLAGQNPDFTTFCYQCLFYRPDMKRCQLQLDGQEVRDITLNRRTYCTSFRPDRAGEPSPDPSPRPSG